MARKSTARMYKAGIFAISTNMESALDNLEAEIREKVIRSGAFAGSSLMYGTMKMKAPVYKGRPKKGITPGQLRDSIYQYHADDVSGPYRHVYYIGPNKRKAPHWHWVEYGTRHSAAYPYIRPTWYQNKDQLGPVVLARMAQRITELVDGVTA